MEDALAVLENGTGRLMGVAVAPRAAQECIADVRVLESVALKRVRRCRSGARVLFNATA